MHRAYQKTYVFLLTKYQLNKGNEIPCNACLQFHSGRVYTQG